MVVLDEHAIAQSQPMIDTPTEAHGVFVQGAQPRHGLAGTQHLGLESFETLHQAGCGAGHTAHARQQVECGALGSKDARSRPVQAHQHGAGCHSRTFCHTRLHQHAGIHHAKGQGHCVETSDHPGLSSHDHRMGCSPACHQGTTGVTARS